jgi:hypothetical protein
LSTGEQGGLAPSGLASDVCGNYPQLRTGVLNADDHCTNTAEKVDVARRMHASREHTLDVIASTIGVSRTTCAGRCT